MPASAARLALHLACALALAGAWPASAQIADDSGASCSQISDLYADAPISTDERLVLSADSIDLEKDGLSKLAGTVRLVQGGKEFSAESLDYDDANREVHVRAESVFRNKELIIRSKAADFDLDDETGSFLNTDFTVPQRAARGASSKITLSRAGNAELDEVRYTTCAPGSEAWYLEAGEIKLDYSAGLGVARNARLRFFKVPIFYAPWFRFPIDNRRRTGLLFPTVGDSARTGLDIRQPVYFNLAPNYDATLTPRYMSSRGIQLNGEGRYLLPRAEGALGYEWLGHDSLTGRKRDYAHFEHLGLLNNRLALDARFAEASDDQYFEDLGGKLDISSITQLERSARLTYQAPAAYTVQGLVQDYQTISSSLTPVQDPYRRLPQIRVDALTRNTYYDTRAGLQAEFVNFVRQDSVQGQRLDLDPFLRMERDHVGWFARGQFDLRYTNYALHDTAPDQPDTPERALPQVSAEGGLRFERIRANGDVQTLEPRVFYLYVPYKNQDNLPVFDSGEPDFDFTQLFARNRFSGEDRISDANQIAIAATGRQLDPRTGEAWITASVGQLYRLAKPQVNLPGTSTPEGGATDFIGALDYRVSGNWRAGLTSQWTPERSNFNRVALGVHYLSETRRLDLAYRFRRDLLEQADLTASTPVTRGVRLAGRWRYSIKDQQSLDTLAGVEYETCCWAVRTSYRRYIASTSGQYNNGVYLQLELKGLTRIGSGFPGLLPVEEEVY